MNIYLVTVSTIGDCPHITSHAIMAGLSENEIQSRLNLKSLSIAVKRMCSLEDLKQGHLITLP